MTSLEQKIKENDAKIAELNREAAKRNAAIDRAETESRKLYPSLYDGLPDMRGK